MSILNTVAQLFKTNFFINNKYVLIMGGLGLLILAALILAGFFYRRESLRTNKIIENLKKEIQIYQNMVAQMQKEQNLLDQEKAGPSTDHVSHEEKDKRIWVKIRSFD